MPKFTNFELKTQILPALAVVIKLQLPIDGAMRLRKIIKDISEHLAVVEELRLDTLRTFAELDDEGRFVMIEGADGKPTNNVKTKSKEAEESFSEFLVELMLKEYECKLTINKKHLEDDKHPWNARADLIVNLGDLMQDEEESK